MMIEKVDSFQSYNMVKLSFTGENYLNRMKTKLLVIADISFIILSLLFAFYWNKIYDGGPDEKKGDYIFFCLKITMILTFGYLIVKFSIRKSFPILLVFVLPFINCFVSVMLALLISILIGETGDRATLQVYLFIHAFLAIGFVHLLQYFANKKKAGI